MASFAGEVKNELARIMPETECCQKAELAALLRMGASIMIGAHRSVGLNFATENAAIARKTLSLLKAGYQLKTEVMVSRGRRLKKNNCYTIRVVPSPEVKELLVTIGFMQDDEYNAGSGDQAILRSICCRQSYLRGAFLGGGSVNKPESDYHLELVTASYGFAMILYNLLKKFGLPVGITERKQAYIIYLKEAESIIEFLQLTGAEDTVTDFEVARNVKDVRNQVNRLVNCETANLNKTVNAAFRQMERIKLLDRIVGLDKLPPKLREAAELRLENPEAALQELVTINHDRISKSGLNHRFRKLEQMAAELEGEEQ